MTVMEAKPTRNIARLAMEVGVSRQTIYTWKDEGCPVDRGAEAVREWRATHHPPPSSGSDQTKLARARLIDAQSYWQELKNLERDGELINAQDAAQDIAEAMTILAARLEQIPDEARKDLPADCRDRVAARMDELIHLALKECSAKMRSVANGDAA